MNQSKEIEIFGQARDVDLGEATLTLQYAPLSEVSVLQTSTHAYLSYHINASDAQNPCDSDCAAGHIYSAHRHSATHREMQQALGRDREWQPDLEHEEVMGIARRKVVEALKADTPEAKAALQQALEALDMSEAELQAKLKSHYLNPDYFYQEDMFEEAGLPGASGYLKEGWERALKEGRIGNPFRVSVDVYDHSAVTYSVSGEGYVCRWDTSRGGALWVPNDYLMQSELWPLALAPFDLAIVEKPADYQWLPSETGQDFGDGIKKTYTLVHPAVYTVTQKSTGKAIGFRFPTFEGALKSALRHLGDKWKPEEGFAAAHPRAIELAREICKQYTSWSNGWMTELVVEAWELTRDDVGEVVEASFIDSKYPGREYFEADEAKNDVEPALREFANELQPELEAQGSLL